MNEQLLGILMEIVRQTYYSEDTEYGIYKCEVLELIRGDKREEPVTDFMGKSEIKSFVGNCPKLTIGKQYNVICEKVVHPKYGWQYKILSISFPDNDETDEVAFLGTMVTELQFDNIIEVYPENPITMIVTGEFDYTKVRGFGEKSFETLKKKIEDNIHLMKALAVLGKFGITYNQTRRIVDTYGDAKLAIDKVMNNPYILYKEVDGIGFMKADSIARAIGIQFDDVNRIKAGIMYAVETEENKGNTWTYIKDIIEIAENILDLEIEDIDFFIQNNFDFYVDKEEEVIALAKTRACENDVCNHLKRIAIIDSDNDEEFIEEENDYINNTIKDIEINLNITYTDKQKELFYAFQNNNVVTLTGYAGSGKTTLLNGFLNMLDKGRTSYLLCSPTAKAAKVLTKATGREAFTIHRALRWTPLGFQHNHNEPLPYDMVIVDEVSMVDIWLMRSLLDSVQYNTKILFVGDPAQLESISTGNLLNDVIESKVFPVIKLDKVFRQALDSGIISVATDVRQGRSFYKGEDKVLEIGVNKDLKAWFGEKSDTAPRVLKIFNDCIKRYPIEDIMVLSPMKNGVSGIKNLNNLLQGFYNPEDSSKNQIDLKRCIFRVGDKVIHIRNLYEEPWLNNNYSPTGGMGIFNGDTGIIKKIDMNLKIIYVDYGDKIIAYHKGLYDTLELAYAITVHKSQGSSSKIVIMALDFSHYKNLKRSLIYTGITRTSDILFIVAEKKALSFAIKNNEVARKRTFLKELLNK
jgi:RecD/TraA family predicted helicase